MPASTVHTPPSAPCDVLILGAGASGMFCAVHAARRGRRVTVLDHGPKTLRKVRISGGGRCNFTNLELGPEDYVSGNPHFCKSALARYTPWDAVAYLATHAIGYEEREFGQLFCDPDALALVRALEADARGAGVRVLLRRSVDGVERETTPGGDPLYRVRSGGEAFTAPKLVIATGGPSWPDVGASDLAVRLARQFGLRVEPLRPALAPLVLPGEDGRICRELTGIALRVAASCGHASFATDLLFTHRGVSGPAALQLSTTWTPGQPVTVNLLPGLDLERELLDRRGENVLLRNAFAGRLPGRLPPLFLGEQLGGVALSRLTEALRAEAAARLQTWTFTPSRTEGMAKAEVAAGGVDTAAFSSKTMECTAVPGLYVLGEALDVTGRLGGYNLHWAFASGFAAAQHL